MMNVFKDEYLHKLFVRLVLVLLPKYNNYKIYKYKIQLFLILAYPVNILFINEC